MGRAWHIRKKRVFGENTPFTLLAGKKNKMCMCVAHSTNKTSAPLTLKTRSLSAPNAMRMHALTPVYGTVCKLSAQSSN